MPLLDLLKKASQSQTERLSAKELLRMTLDQLEKADVGVRIKSELLGQDIYLVPNHEQSKMPTETGVVPYSTNEVRHLIKIRIDKLQLKAIHLTKKVFDGVIMPTGVK